MRTQSRPKRKWLRNTIALFCVALFLAAIFFWWLIREPHHLPWVKGTPESRVQSYFGMPDWDESFWLTNEPVIEYRMGLQLSLPEVDFSCDSVLIKEYSWHSDSWDYRIWFKQQSGEWVVVDDLFWTKAIQF